MELGLTPFEIFIETPAVGSVWPFVQRLSVKVLSSFGTGSFADNTLSLQRASH